MIVEGPITLTLTPKKLVPHQNHAKKDSSYSPLSTQLLKWGYHSRERPPLSPPLASDLWLVDFCLGGEEDPKTDSSLSLPTGIDLMWRSSKPQVALHLSGSSGRAGERPSEKTDGTIRHRS